MAKNELVSPEMDIISITQMKRVVKHVAVRKNKVVYFEGGSGIGKTVGIEQVCEEEGYFYCPILTSQYDTVDFKGTPWPEAIEGPYGAAASFEAAPSRRGGGLDDDDVIVGLEGLDDGEPAMRLAPRKRPEFTVWKAASTLPFVGNPLFPTNRVILLFLDEMPSASIPVMAVLYQLLDKRRVGEHVLMPNVRIVGAGNRAEDRGVINRMPLPLCNRMTWYGVVLDLPGWTEFMTVKHGVAAAPFIAYFNWMKAELHNYDPSNPKRVFCSPRTADTACEYFLDKEMPDDIKLASMAGAIGSDISAKVWGYFEIWRGVQELMVDIAKNPKTAAIPPENNVQWAIALSISGILTCKNASTYYEYLKRMDGEYCIAAWQMAVAREQKDIKHGKMKKDAPKLYDSDPFIDMARRYKALFSRT